MPAPNRDTARKRIIKIRETASIFDKKQMVNKRVLSEEKLEEMGERLEHTSQEFLRRLAQETNFDDLSMVSYQTFKIETIQADCCL